MSRPHLELESLADTLWAERHVVEYLLFKLVTAKLLLAADERRFINHAMDEVSRVTESLREVEHRRAQALVPVAHAWGLSTSELTLAELCTRSPAPMNTVFHDLQKAFLRLAEEIEETAATNRRLASAGLNHVRTTLDTLTGPAVTNTYTASGRHDYTVRAPMRLDQVL